MFYLAAAKIKEWVSFIGGTPNLKTLWFAKGPDVEKQRYSTFLACFHLQDGMEELQALEAPVAAFCCLLAYLMMQVTGTVAFSSAVSPDTCD